MTKNSQRQMVHIIRLKFIIQCKSIHKLVMETTNRRRISRRAADSCLVVFVSFRFFFVVHSFGAPIHFYRIETFPCAANEYESDIIYGKRNVPMR